VVTVRVLVTVGADGAAAVCDPRQPLLAADDLAAVRGDGVFETLLVRAGVVREEQAHLARLGRSAGLLDLRAPEPDAWRDCLAAVRREWASDDDLVVRLVLSRGPDGADTPTAYATGGPVSATTVRQREHGVSAVCLERGYASDLSVRAPWLLLGAKTLSYAVNMSALRHAASRGAEDVVFTAADGLVLEGPTSTVVVANGRALRTPPVDTGILAGTTQDALFRAAVAAGFQCRVEPLRAEELVAADGVWLLSSVRLLARVHTLDGVALTDSGLDDELASLLG